MRSPTARRRKQQINLLFGKRLQGNAGRKTKRAPSSPSTSSVPSSLLLSKHAEAADKKVQSLAFQTATAKAHQCPHGLSEGLINSVA